MNDIADIFIVGGGINGAGIARDAAGRGLSVVLAEKDDLASHTSSSSTKLIHGGLRYLEHYEFRLVRESLKEREVLLNAAPHLIKPIRFILPLHRAMRPAFILRLGLFLYDYIGGRKLLPATVTVNLKKSAAGKPLKSQFSRAFEYSDCTVDDARLVLLSAKAAANKGAKILTRAEVTSTSRKGGIWTINLTHNGGKASQYRARTLVNAAGPWVDHIEGISTPTPKSKKKIRMVKGSHIIVPKLYDGKQAYTFQHDDKRVIFAIPYQRDFTLIGTTDMPFDDDANAVEIEAAERQYLCDVTSRYFEKNIEPSDIVWAYSGVRPLVDDGAENASNATRDYVLEYDDQEAAPMLSIYGGKITTFRRLAEEALQTLQPHLGFKAGNWTEGASMPGGDMGYKGLPAFKQAMQQQYSWLEVATLDRMVGAYGTYLPDILGDASATSDLGADFGAGLSEAELVFMKNNEWAQSAEDALWRRSKLGLHLNETQRQVVAAWFEKP